VYTVYKIIHLLSGRFYVGVHKTDNPADDYFGSGAKIKEAIAQFGLENFKKEILGKFDCPEDAFKMEADIVTSEAIESGWLFNKMLGGKGGWDYVNQTEARLAGTAKVAELIRNDNEFRKAWSLNRSRDVKRAFAADPTLRQRTGFGVRPYDRTGLNY
jgi:hypothetical protein